MSRARRLAVPAAGPILIVVAVAVVLHDYAFGGLTATTAADPLTFFLPTHCFLGDHLAAGDVPLWNRHVMAGLPFAADGQSGWMNLPAMLLYTALPCHVAFGWYVVLHPAIAGLALYAFLRTEGLSRAAATTGALALALPVAGSSVAAGSLPFSASLAWTAVLLATGARYRRATTPSSRLGWVLLVALAWGQLAAAHLSIGLLLGSGALAVSLGAGLASDVRGGRRTPRAAVGAVLLLVVAVPLVNAAVLLPRIAYLPRTTLGLGYARLESLTAELTGRPGPFGALGAGIPLARPAGLAAAPGYYLGAALAPTFLAFAHRARRGLVLAFAGYGAACFALASVPVVEALEPAQRWWPGALYQHVPSRLFFGLLVALPVLSAAGVDAWLRGPRGWIRAGLLLPPVVLWVGLPVAWSGRSVVLPAAGVAAGAAVLAVLSVRPRWAAALPALLAVQLAASGLAGHVFGDPDTTSRTVAAGDGKARPLWPAAAPNAEVSDYLREGPIARALMEEGGGRYLSIDGTSSFPSGYRGQLPGMWGMLAGQQSMVFGLEEAQGYNPAQPPRYWTFVRRADPKRIAYARAWFLNPPPVALDLLGVEWVIAPHRRWVPVPGATVKAREGRWRLFRLPAAPGRASVVTSWSVAREPEEALQLVMDPGFDPAGTVVVEEAPPFPGPGRSPEGGWARFRWLGTESARVEVEAPSPAMVLVRNGYDPNWRATVDGREAPVLAGDLFLQAIPVPAGRHTVILRFHEPSIGWGLAISAAAVALLLVAAAVGRRRRVPGAAGGGEDGGGAVERPLTPASRPLPWRDR